MRAIWVLFTAVLLGSVTDGSDLESSKNTTLPNNGTVPGNETIAASNETHAPTPSLMNITNIPTVSSNLTNQPSFMPTSANTSTPTVGPTVKVPAETATPSASPTTAAPTTAAPTTATPTTAAPTVAGQIVPTNWEEVAAQDKGPVITTLVVTALIILCICTGGMRRRRNQYANLHNPNESGIEFRVRGDTDFDMLRPLDTSENRDLDVI